MIPRRFTYGAGAVAILLGALVLALTPGGRAQDFEGNYGIGIPEVFVPKYLAFRTAQIASGSPDVMRIKLGYVKGLSRSFVAMAGEAAIDLGSGAFTVNLAGLTPLETYTVWLVNQTDTDPPVDTVAGLVTFVASEAAALLNGTLPVNFPVDFTIDRVVVTPGTLADVEPLAAGLVNVFQKIFFRRLSLLNESTGEVMFDETTPPPARFALVPPLQFTASGGSSGQAVAMDGLISRGAQLFFEETFKGNGRTCGTCHPVSNNFTIDAAFIKTLPATDPLFVAEFNPALAQLERPELMRQFGLILENLDGFSDPTNKFVMRGVPHTLGLQVSLAQDPTQQPMPPAEMTGWSGDGSPGTGSLREFAIGAVIQHFTRRLDRVEGTDFRLPQPLELDAMEAFQLSLGRDRDFNLSTITFRDSNVETGKSLFVNGGGDPINAGGTCAGCHGNAGALNALGRNGNVNTNVEDVEHPARSIQRFPKDGGFGRTDNGDGTFGNRTFNTASVVEAAQSAPFFHNNVVTTLEGTVAFYSGPEFNNPRPGPLRFNFDETQRNEIANFMRAINTLQNVDVGTRELREILANRRDPRREQDRRLQSALVDTQNGIRVLTEGGIYPNAVTTLTDARDLILRAQKTGGGQRRSLVQEAITKLGEARALVATS
jgi:mono/diheme cytochrome c family protein